LQRLKRKQAITEYIIRVISAAHRDIETAIGFLAVAARSREDTVSYLWKLRKKVELQVTHITLPLLYHNVPFWMPASVHGAGGKKAARRQENPSLVAY